MRIEQASKYSIYISLAVPNARYTAYHTAPTHKAETVSSHQPANQGRSVKIKRDQERQGSVGEQFDLQDG
jgi:hypothetical protein